MGEWISWSYQLDDSNTFINPVICIDSIIQDKIDEKMTVLVRGKKYTIKLKEIMDINEFITSKSNPLMDNHTMQDISTKDGGDNENLNASKNGEVLESGQQQKEATVYLENHKLIEDVRSDEAVDKVTSSSNSMISKVPESDFSGSPANPIQNIENLKDVLDINIVRKEIRSPISSDSGLSPTEKISKDKGKVSDDSNTMGAIVDNILSQSTLCKSIGTLKMGRTRGRPRKKARNMKNPFELGLGLKKSFHSKTKMGVLSKANKKSVLNTIPEKTQFLAHDEAGQIIESAKLMGLSIAVSEE